MLASLLLEKGWCGVLANGLPTAVKKLGTFCETLTLRAPPLRHTDLDSCEMLPHGATTGKQNATAKALGSQPQLR